MRTCASHQALTKQTGATIVVLLSLAGARALAKPDPRPDLVIVGSVTVTTRRVPSCGGGAFAMKVRFKVEQVVEGDYKQPFVDVLVPCPEFFRIRLTTGSRARLELAVETSRNKRRWASMGELPEPRFPQYQLIRAEQK